MWLAMLRVRNSRYSSVSFRMRETISSSSFRAFFSAASLQPGACLTFFPSSMGALHDGHCISRAF